MCKEAIFLAVIFGFTVNGFFSLREEVEQCFAMSKMALNLPPFASGLQGLGLQVHGTASVLLQG